MAQVVASSLSGKGSRSEEHTSELQSLRHLVCRLLLEKKKNEVVENAQEEDRVEDWKLADRRGDVRHIVIGIWLEIVEDRSHAEHRLNIETVLGHVGT